MHRRLRLGMVGGGQGAFIGAIHRIAARMDNEYDLVCGAFSSDAERSLLSGAEYGLVPSRIYSSWEQMFAMEKMLDDAERMEVVAIVTPNHLHFAPAKAAMESGVHVIMDKPVTFDLKEALELKEISARTGMLFCLTHTYAGYPMIKEARHRVLTGEIGMVRKVYVEYPQGWLSSLLEASGQKQAAWRTDPGQSGIAGAMGDIGTHAFNMAEYVSGLKVVSVCADINTIVNGRMLDDDGSVLLKFNNGATGILFASQVAAGEENNIKIRVYGEKGGMEWEQDKANTLVLKWPDKPAAILRAGANNKYLCAAALANCRTPAGHPEGYLEAFANHYRNFAYAVKANGLDKNPQQEGFDYPGIEEGIRGMAFIEAVIASGKTTEKWLPLSVSI